MSTYRRAVSLVLSTLVLLSVVTFPVGQANAAAPGVVSADERFEAANGVYVWEQSVLTLRTDFQGAATEVPIGDFRGKLEDTGETTLNRGPVGIVNAGEQVTIEFSDDLPSRSLSDPEVEFIAGRINRDGKLPTTFAEGFDLLNTTNANQNATWQQVKETDLSDGDATFTFTPDTPGHYVLFVAATGGTSGPDDGFNVDAEGNLTLTNDVTVLGMEGFTAQRGPASVDAPSSIQPGDDPTFSVDTSDEFAQDDVTHVLAVYNEDTFTDFSKSQFTLAVEEGEIDKNLNLTEDSTLNHSIKEAVGVADVEDGIRVNGVDLSNGRVARSVNLGGVIDFVVEDLGGNPPKTNAVGDTTLYASVTAEASESPQEDLTIETFNNWSTGTYRYVYIGTLESNGSAVSTATGTFSVGTGAAPTPAAGGGGGGGGGGFFGPTTTRFTPKIQNADALCGVTITVQGLSTLDASASELQAFPANVPAVPGTFIAGADITVPQRVQNTPGTMELCVNRKRLQDRGLTSQDLQVYKYNSSAQSWTALPTQVASVKSTQVILHVEVDGFSLFAVSTRPAKETPTPTATPTPTPPGATPTSTPTATASPSPTTEGGLPGFGPVVAVVALITAGLLARRRD